MSVRSEKQLRRRLAIIEKEMAHQTAACIQHGFHSGYGFCWDRRCVERATLRWALGLPKNQFNAADTMAGW